MKSKRAGFTLAEVLITLGIIGIVAAITIPTLVQNIQEYSWKQAFKKNFSVIAQAYERVKQDEGGDLSSYFSSGQYYVGGTTDIVDKMGAYLAVVQSCAVPNVGTFATICNSNPSVSLVNYYKTLSNGYVDYDNLQHGQYVLKDGTNLYFRTWNTDGFFLVWVDVNGYIKKPNTLGKDLFGISITKNKVMPMGAMGTGVENTCITTSIACPSGYTYGFHTSGDCAGASCSMDALYK